MEPDGFAIASTARSRLTSGAIGSGERHARKTLVARQRRCMVWRRFLEPRSSIVHAFQSRPCALPLIATLALASGAVFAQSQAPSSADKVKVQKLVKPAGLSDRNMTMNDVAALPTTRDWSKIDTNKDNLVSPEEMEAYLKANPEPLAAK